MSLEGRGRYKCYHCTFQLENSNFNSIFVRYGCSFLEVLKLSSALFKVWLLDQQHRQHPGAFENCGIASPNLLQFNKIIYVIQ